MSNDRISNWTPSFLNYFPVQILKFPAPGAGNSETQGLVLSFMMLATPATPFGKLTAGSAGTARATVFKEPFHSSIEKAPENSVHPFPYTAL
jgi:hypothetical protein